TRSKRDWSSDVCSSDLAKYGHGAGTHGNHLGTEVAGLAEAGAGWEVGRSWRSTDDKAQGEEIKFPAGVTPQGRGIQNNHESHSRDRKSTRLNSSHVSIS